MIIKLDKRFLKQAKGRFEKYDFQVGILRDAPHYLPADKDKGLKSYADGPARRISRKPSGKSIAEVSQDLRKLVGNFYTLPFKMNAIKRNRDILNFTKEFFQLCAGRSQPRRLENLLQAIVRNPILRGDYGKNSKTTSDIKGFNRFMIDTAQLFKAIRARVRVRRV